MKEILESVLKNIKETNLVLCTITGKSGSGPREAGAQMLVGPGGLLAGTIGGGSVEQESIAFSKNCMAEKASASHEFLLYINQAEDIGMVCGGRVTVQFQYIPKQDPGWAELCRSTLSAIQNRKKGFFLIDPSDGTSRLVLSGEGIPEGVFPIPLPVGERVILFGAGHISVALAPVLSRIGFHVTVFDNRSDFATKERFPDADAIIIGEYEHIEDFLSIQPEDYLVVLTSGHSFDFEVERQVLQKEFAYLGVIGSKKKTAAVNARLLDAGIPESRLLSVHTPIGLPIQAVTPEEISISIAAEMILVRASMRTGSSPSFCPV